MLEALHEHSALQTARFIINSISALQIGDCRDLLSSWGWFHRLLTLSKWKALEFMYLLLRYETEDKYCSLKKPSPVILPLISNRKCFEQNILGKQENCVCAEQGYYQYLQLRWGTTLIKLKLQQYWRQSPSLVPAHWAGRWLCWNLPWNKGQKKALGRSLLTPFELVESMRCHLDWA